jgi:hypothetical protein
VRDRDACAGAERRLEAALVGGVREDEGLQPRRELARLTDALDLSRPVEADQKEIGLRVPDGGERGTRVGALRDGRDARPVEQALEALEQDRLGVQQDGGAGVVAPARRRCDGTLVEQGGHDQRLSSSAAVRSRAL